MEDKVALTKNLIDLLSTAGGKIVIIILAAAAVIGILNKIIFPLFGLKFTTKWGTFGGNFWENKEKKNKESKPIHLDDDLKTSILEFSYEIINDAQNHFQELTDKTKDRLEDYIKAIQGCYETSLNDDYKGDDKEFLLQPNSLKYLKNLMELASFKKDVITKITNGVKDLIELEDENASDSEKAQKKTMIISEIKEIYTNVFVGREDPCRDMVDTKTINTIIEEQAKLKVGDILTRLIPEFKIKDKQFDNDLNNTISAFLSKLEENQSDK